MFCQLARHSLVLQSSKNNIHESDKMKTAPAMARVRTNSIVVKRETSFSWVLKLGCSYNLRERMVGGDKGDACVERVCKPGEVRHNSSKVL